MSGFMLAFSSNTKKLSLIICFITFLVSDISVAQFFYFGRNKVHYEEIDWKILRTDHFDIYYYSQISELNNNRFLFTLNNSKG